jgi:hypothetical protein
VRHQPGAGQGDLPADVGEGRQHADRHRAEQARRQVLRQSQHAQAAQRTGQSEEKSRGEELADHQAADHHAQQADPGRIAPAVAHQHH